MQKLNMLKKVKVKRKNHERQQWLASLVLGAFVLSTVLGPLALAWAGNPSPTQNPFERQAEKPANATGPQTTSVTANNQTPPSPSNSIGFLQQPTLNSTTPDPNAFQWIGDAIRKHTSEKLGNPSTGFGKIDVMLASNRKILSSDFMGVSTSNTGYRYITDNGWNTLGANVGKRLAGKDSLSREDRNRVLVALGLNPPPSPSPSPKGSPQTATRVVAACSVTQTMNIKIPSINCRQVSDGKSIQSTFVSPAGTSWQKQDPNRFDLLYIARILGVKSGDVSGIYKAGRQMVVSLNVMPPTLSKQSSSKESKGTSSNPQISNQSSQTNLSGAATSTSDPVTTPNSEHVVYTPQTSNPSSETTSSSPEQSVSCFIVHTMSRTALPCNQPASASDQDPGRLQNFLNSSYGQEVLSILHVSSQQVVGTGRLGAADGVIVWLRNGPSNNPQTSNPSSETTSSDLPPGYQVVLEDGTKWLRVPEYAGLPTADVVWMITAHGGLDVLQKLGIIPNGKIEFDPMRTLNTMSDAWRQGKIDAPFFYTVDGVNYSIKVRYHLPAQLGRDEGPYYLFQMNGQGNGPSNPSQPPQQPPPTRLQPQPTSQRPPVSQATSQSQSRRLQLLSSLSRRTRTKS